MQVRKPDAPIRASAPMPLKNAPEHRPIADSSRLTCTWRKRESTANCRINGVVQPAGRLATSEVPHAAAASAIWTATAPLSLMRFDSLDGKGLLQNSVIACCCRCLREGLCKDRDES